MTKGQSKYYLLLTFGNLNVAGVGARNAAWRRPGFCADHTTFRLGKRFILVISHHRSAYLTSFSLLGEIPNHPDLQQLYAETVPGKEYPYLY